MMTPKEQTIELIAQTLAPRLFKLFGVAPEDMGFPIYDTKEEVEVHLARMSDPITYWTDEARKIVVSVFNILEAGGAKLDDVALVQAVFDAAALERPDVVNGEAHPI